MRLLITFLLLPIILSANMTEEAQIDLLINACTKNLERLTQLKKALDAFKSQEAICLDDPENNDQLFMLSQKALELKTTLKYCHIDDYFRPQFLTEINNLAKSAEHPTLPAMNRDVVR